MNANTNATIGINWNYYCFLTRTNQLKYLVFILFFFSFSFVRTQNLIPNPSFENHQDCSIPIVNSTIELCDDWFNAFPPNNTVDWYSDCLCGINNDLCPPILFYGDSNPYEGQAMIGLDPYIFINGNREILGVKLNEPLIYDSAYCISFWVKNSMNHGYIYSVNHLDLLFTIDSSGLLNPETIVPSVRIENEGQLNHGNDWVEINAFFISQGNEQFMYIGEFGNPPLYYHSDPDAVTSTAERIYYYLDDFELYPCNKDSLIETVFILPNVFTPNDDHVNDLYEISMKNIDSLDIIVLNRWGNVLIEFDGLNYKWDGTDKNNIPLSDGVYFVKAIVYPKFQEQFVQHQSVHVIR